MCGNFNKSLYLALRCQAPLRSQISNLWHPMSFFSFLMTFYDDSLYLSFLCPWSFLFWSASPIDRFHFEHFRCHSILTFSFYDQILMICYFFHLVFLLLSVLIFSISLLLNQISLFALLEYCWLLTLAKKHLWWLFCSFASVIFHRCVAGWNWRWIYLCYFFEVPL